MMDVTFFLSPFFSLFFDSLRFIPGPGGNFCRSRSTGFSNWILFLRLPRYSLPIAAGCPSRTPAYGSDITHSLETHEMQLLAVRGKFISDLAAKDLIVLFAGINPGLYTTAIGRHFGRPGNRFWPALYDGGFTPRLFSPFEESLLLDLGFGITNIVRRDRAGG